MNIHKHVPGTRSQARARKLLAHASASAHDISTSNQMTAGASRPRPLQSSCERISVRLQGTALHTPVAMQRGKRALLHSSESLASTPLHHSPASALAPQ